MNGIIRAYKNNQLVAQGRNQWAEAAADYLIHSAFGVPTSYPNHGFFIVPFMDKQYLTPTPAQSFSKATTSAPDSDWAYLYREGWITDANKCVITDAFSGRQVTWTQAANAAVAATDLSDFTAWNLTTSSDLTGAMFGIWDTSNPGVISEPDLPIAVVMFDFTIPAFDTGDRLSLSYEIDFLD